MPATLHANAVTVRRGPQLVLDAVSFTVAPGHRIGLVGPNGVGKSTLLGTLARRVELEHGSVQLLPPTATIGWLPQQAERRAGEQVRELLARRSGVGPAEVELAAATEALAAGDDGADDRYSTALERWLALGAADFDTRLGEAGRELGLAQDLLDRETTVLSGGEAARVGLAALLLSRYDVYLLDEPTNDLDLDGLARLEQWVTQLAAGVVLVSHDRTFLRRTVTDVVELDEHAHTATWYGGGWDAFQQERETARRHARQRYDEYKVKRRGLASRAQREREWATQGLSRAKKRPTDNDKFVTNLQVNQTEQLAGRAARTERAIDRLEVVERPHEPWQLKLQVASPGRSGDVVAGLHGVVVEQGSFTLGPIDLEVRFGERVAIVGRNGSGKTTLIRAILGRAPLTSGRCHVGASVVIGEIEQAREQLVGASTFLRSFTDASRLTTSEARTLLAKFGLGAEHVVRPTETFSPGERTRAALALVMANGANCLVLDEPTNHLDLPAIEQLEVALSGFGGTVLLVSHDRALLEAVTLTRTVHLDGGRVVGDHAV